MAQQDVKCDRVMKIEQETAQRSHAQKGHALMSSSRFTLLLLSMVLASFPQIVSAQHATAFPNRHLSRIAATPGTVQVGADFAEVPTAKETMILKNGAGLKWEPVRTDKGWTLGSLSLNGKLIERPLLEGLLALRQVKTGQIRWLAASKGERVSDRTARFSGREQVSGVAFTWSIELALHESLPAATLHPRWSVDRALGGWEMVMSYHGQAVKSWRVQSYPWAGSSEAVDITPMRYCGVPAALIYRPDLSLVVMFAIDASFDYLNPTTWTGKTSFHFKDGVTPPQFRAGGGMLSPQVEYEHPLQLFFSDAGGFPRVITGLVNAWMKVNHYKVDETLFVRAPEEAFRIAVEGRKKMSSWKPAIGYEHHEGTPFVYVASNPYYAYFEYRLYEMTGDKEWRQRAMEQIDFALKGQQSDPTKPQYGVINTAWFFEKRGEADGFCSWDWDHKGYKVDLNAWAARYILQTWQRVKQHERLDRQDWYKAAVAAANWVIAQQNSDGGLPQIVDVDSGERSTSVVSARALVSLPIISEITGDPHYLKVSEGMEKFLRTNVEGRFWYTGAHPDLPPNDFEQDSIYGVVEYWLNKYDRTRDREYLEHAVANAYYALLYWCPKQLSWVKSPTQGAHSEQQHYNQYSVYNYHNRKIQCLTRLAQMTGDPLFSALAQRVLQLNFYTEVTDGPYQGSLTEAIADPWLEREGGYEHRGSPYTSELVVDLMLQLMDLGMVGSDGMK
jgi:hypothetical protein